MTASAITMAQLAQGLSQKLGVEALICPYPFSRNELKNAVINQLGLDLTPSGGETGRILGGGESGPVMTLQGAGTDRSYSRQTLWLLNQFHRGVLYPGIEGGQFCSVPGSKVCEVVVGEGLSFEGLGM